MALNTLIYHDPLKSGEASPFDSALLQVSDKADPLYLASPYIGLSFLSRILENAHDWKLLSDIEAWLSSGNRRHRAQCWAFISGNLDRIKHVPDLHAKVAIGNNALFLGSANFTEKGILGRTELSILVKDPVTVSDATAWFESLWDTASPPVIKEGDELITALDQMQWTTSKSRLKLSSTAPKVSSVLSGSVRPKGFDVAATLARAGISESEKLQSLEDAYRSISDAWFQAEREFTFAEILSAISKLVASYAIDDVWALITSETANHWLGGLSPEGFDRYYYRNNHFIKWDAVNLSTTGQIDDRLCFLIENIKPSPEASYLPSDESWLMHGIAAHQIIPFTEQLIELGLLIEQDNPGELELYSIDTEFEWPKRWYKFVKARKAFQALNANQVKPKVSKESFNNNSPSSDYTENIQAIKSLKMAVDLDFIQQKSELIETAATLGISKEALIEKREELLAAVFELIKDKDQNLETGDMQSLRDELLNHPMPDSLLAEFVNFKTGMCIKQGGQTQKVKPYKQWVAYFHLDLYPMALKAWKGLFT